MNEYKPGTVARVMKYLERDRTFGTEHPLVALHTLLTCIDQLRVETSHGASYMHGTLCSKPVTILGSYTLEDVADNSCFPVYNCPL